jgi:hypothetical protein
MNSVEPQMVDSSHLIGPSTVATIRGSTLFIMAEED